MLLLALACAPPPLPLRYPEITAGILARIDLDHDGRVDAEEYGRVSLADDPLSNYDADGDGALSASEVESSILDTNPAVLAAARVDAVVGALQPGGAQPRNGQPPNGQPPNGQPPNGQPRNR